MIYFFANCKLDTVSHAFFRDGAPVHLEPQVFDLLHLLAGRAGHLVTKDDLVEEIWKGRIVSDATISARINAARMAVGDTGKDQQVIRTVSRRGFEMVASVSNDAIGTVTVDAPVPATQTIRYTQASDETQIAYAISGTGPPLIRAGHFLTHIELDWQSPVFRPMIDDLAENHTLVRYDQRGTGLSQADIDELSIEAYAADLLAAADAAGVERFSIFAASQGAPISIHFAANHPERVDRLVLWGGFAQGRLVRDDRFSRDEAEALMTLVRMGWGNADSAFMSAFISIFCPDASREERASLAESQLASATPEMAARIRMTIDRFDVVDRLAEVQAPTLIIHASGDALHPVSQARLLASNIPNAEFKLVRSNNHILLKSTPAWDEVMPAALEFLDRDLS